MNCARGVAMTLQDVLQQGMAVASFGKVRRVALLAALTLGTALPAAAQMVDGAVHIGIIRPAIDGADALTAPVARGAAQGAAMAQDEFGFNASMFEMDFDVVTIEASGADVVAAAEELAAAGVFGIAGGFTGDEAALLSEWATDAGLPFYNMAASDDVLRHEGCAINTFHIAPSAAQYLDALAGWYVRAGLRQWALVVGDDDVSRAQAARLAQGLKDRHFGARIVAEVTMPAGGAFEGDALDDVTGSGADVVVLLTPAADQLTAMAALEEAEMSAMLTGFPHIEAQTRSFMRAAYEAAPVLGSGMRAVAWEPTLDAYGARELNARYLQTYGEPMEQAAWAGYQAVKMLFEGAMFTGSTAPDKILPYMADQNTAFDIWKGIVASFRPWDHQLRQPLYLTAVDGTSETDKLVGQLVGELPAIYLPGTDPIERLDQLGDMADVSRCTF